MSCNFVTFINHLRYNIKNTMKAHILIFILTVNKTWLQLYKPFLFCVILFPSLLSLNSYSVKDLTIILIMGGVISFIGIWLITSYIYTDKERQNDINIIIKKIKALLNK